MLELDTALWAVEKTLGSTIVSLRCGELTLLQVDAIVHYARTDLALTAGFGRVIRIRGGPAVEDELEAIGSVAMGKAVVTSGGALRAAHVIHSCGPKFDEPQLADKYRQCMYSAIFLADAIHVKTLAFPAMGAGFYGIPLNLCADWMLSSIRAALRAGAQIERIIICLTDRREFETFKAVLEKF